MRNSTGVPNNPLGECVYIYICVCVCAIVSIHVGGIYLFPNVMV